MPKKALLVLEDGTIYEGYAFGAEGHVYGEVVFNTSMTGYQEILTDPSYAGQIVALTYPLVGNYGISRDNVESKKIQVRGFAVREDCPEPSHWDSTQSLTEYLKSNGIPSIGGVDTRALTRRLRVSGVMMGVITSDQTPQEALDWLRSLPRYDKLDFVKEVSTTTTHPWIETASSANLVPQPRIAILDYGVKYNIVRILDSLGCQCTAVPCTSSTEDILALRPDGLVLSPGPGDPALLTYLVESVRQLSDKMPIMGICLGHQILAHAFGGTTFKLKFGHRGANHPVRDLDTGRVHITAQNHGYAVDPDSLKDGMIVNQVNLNDRTVEGMRHRELPIFSIQYHSEASPGPRDNMYLFQRFLEMVRRLQDKKPSA